MGVLESWRESLGILICPCCKIVQLASCEGNHWVEPAHSECWPVAEVETHGQISLWSVWVRLEVSTRNLSPSPCCRCCRPLESGLGASPSVLCFPWWAPRLGLSCSHLCLTSGTQRNSWSQSSRMDSRMTRESPSHNLCGTAGSTDEVASGLAWAKSPPQESTYEVGPKLLFLRSPLHIQLASPPLPVGQEPSSYKTGLFGKATLLTF